MGCQPEVLPGIALGIVAGLEVGGKALGREKVALLVNGTHEAQFRVVELLVAQAAVVEIFVVLGMSEFLGHLCHAPVVEAILHSLAYALVFAVGYIAQLLHPLQLAEVHEHGVLHGLEGLLLLVFRHIALEHHVGQYRH